MKPVKSNETFLIMCFPLHCLCQVPEIQELQKPMDLLTEVFDTEAQLCLPLNFLGADQCNKLRTIERKDLVFSN